MHREDFVRQAAFLEHDGDLPAVVINTAQMTLAFIYSGFKHNPYQKDSRRLSEKERSGRLQDFLDWFSGRCMYNSMILGDYNVDWLSNTVSRNKLMTWCADNNFEQLIKAPTRFGFNALGARTQSCLDLCFARHNEKKILSDTTTLPFTTDHLGITVSIGRPNIKPQFIDVKKWKFTRELVAFARDNPPNADPSIDDVNTLASVLTDWLTNINSLAQSSKRIRSAPFSCLWYTPELSALKNHYSSLPHGNERNRCRNYYVAKVRSTKRAYIRKLTSKYEKSGGIWRVIRNSNKSSGELKLKIDGVTVDNPSTIAKNFKDFFQSKVKSLTKDHDPADIFSALANKFKEVPTWDIDECSIQEVNKAIDNITPNMSCGPDNIPGLLIKHVKHEILPLLTRIINCSISSGIFPSLWNSGRIIPVPKSGSKTNIENYRPICLSSVLGKIVESVIRDKFLMHLDKLLPENMYGFRKSKSTQDAVVHLTDRILELKASGKVVGLLALDASAAFDCLSHDVILSSMKLLGVGPKMINWTANFISNASQYVDINGHHSESYTNSVGVAQGRKFSPDYFNIGTITAAFWCTLAESFLYADDGTNVVAADSVEECNSKLQQAATDLALWYDKIGLSLNIKKSEVLGFGFVPDPIFINNSPIFPRSSIKFLGLIIQSDLKWNLHVDHVCSKIRAAAGRIRYEGRHFSVNDRRKLYFAWAQGSLCSNALAFLPRINQGEKEKIQTACNSAIRAIFGLPRFGRSSITSLREQFHIPSVEMLTEKITLEAAWNRYQAFSEVETPVSGPITRARSNRNFIHPVQTGHRRHLLSTICVLAWNNLPLEIKMETRKTQAFQMIKKFAYKF